MIKEIIYTDENVIELPINEHVEDKDKTLGELFFDKLQHYKNNICQIDAVSGMAQTFDELRSRCIRVAIQMQLRGIKSGDVVSICSKNHLDTCVPLIASFFIGAKVASLDASLSINDIVYLTKLVQPKFIFADDSAVPILESCLEELDFEISVVVFGKSKKYLSFVDFLRGNSKEENFKVYETKNPKETALIFFSSGTTGLPKGICINHYSVIQQGYNFVRSYNLKPTDVSLFYSPLYWVTSLVNITGLTICGGARIIAPIFTQKDFLQIVEKYEITFSFLSPTNVIKLLAASELFDVYDVSSLETVAMAGSPITEHNLKNAQKHFPNAIVMNRYGITEAAGSVISFHGKTDIGYVYSKYVSCGRPVPGFKYKVVDLETGRTLGPNAPGDLRIKSPYLMNGYHNNPEGTKAAWDKDGWLITGDVVYYDDDYCFYIVDRLKEMLKFQNWHITPSELEGIVLRHPCVQDVVVIGIPDSRDGEHAMAVIVKKPGFNTTEKEIIQYVDERVGDIKKLRGGVRFVDRIPLTASGKILRKAAKTMILNNEKF